MSDFLLSLWTDMTNSKKMAKVHKIARKQKVHEDS